MKKLILLFIILFLVSFSFALDNDDALIIYKFTVDADPVDNVKGNASYDIPHINSPVFYANTGVDGGGYITSETDNYFKDTSSITFHTYESGFCGSLWFNWTSDTIDQHFLVYMGATSGGELFLRIDENDVFDMNWGSYVIGNVGAPVQVGELNHLMFSLNSTGTALFLNGNMLGSATGGSIGVANGEISIGARTDGHATAEAIIDEVYFFQQVGGCDFLDAQQLYSGDNLYPFSAGADTTAPTFTFINKTPIDYRIFNVLGQTNIYYNITDASGVDVNSTYLSYKTNSSNRDYFVIVNKSVQTVPIRKVYTSNVSDTYRFTLNDNDVVPAIYNVGEELIENTVHNIYNLDSASEYLKITFYNASGTADFGFIEAMVNNSDPTGSQTLEVYYCNSSYTTGNPVLSDNCINFNSVSAQTVWNHSHNKSAHVVIPFNLNNGMVGSVNVTPLGYVLFRGRASNHAYDMYYINETASDNVFYTTNNGASYTEFFGLPDIHIHRFDPAETFYYQVCGNDTLDNAGCSTVRTDTFDLDPLPPNNAEITSPVGNTYNNSLLIEWNTPSTTGTITYYNISLTDTEQNIITVITSNNSDATTTTFDTTTATDGTYLIRVESINNYTLSSFGFSQPFTIDNTIPLQSWGNPLVNNLTKIYVNNSIQLSATFTDNFEVFSYIVEVISPFGHVVARFNKTNIGANTTNFNETYYINYTGIYTINSSIWDAHTDEDIPVFVHRIDNSRIVFDFSNNKYIDNDDIIIDYIGTYNNVVSLEKDTDRYRFQYVFTGNMGQDPVNHVFRVECEGLNLLDKSKYNAHIVCLNEEKWIDFESDDIIDTSIKTCGIDCLEVNITSEPVNVLRFNSIGTLNKDNILFYFTSNVKPVGMINLLDVGTCPIQSTAYALIYIFFGALLISMFLVGVRYVKIGAFNIIVGFITMLYGVSLYACSPVMGVAGLVLGLGFMLYEITNM